MTVRRLAKLSARVKDGAAMLDACRPGWESGVDLDRLDMADNLHCPLGQVYGHYDRGKERLGLTGWGLVARGFNVSGFASWFGPVDRQYSALTLLWAAEVVVRRRKSLAGRLVPAPKVNTPVLV